MNDDTIHKLEFARIKTALARRCSGALGRALAERIAPSGSIAQVRKWLDQVGELQRVSREVGLPPLGSVRDVRDHVRRAGLPSGLEADALADVSTTLSATGALCRWGASLPDEADLLKRVMERVGDFSPLANRINEVINDRGEVHDHASPKLLSIRNAIDQARRQSEVIFKRLLRQSSITRCLQYAGVTFHNDRKVLPLKAEHRGRVPGIIHRSSDSGATLFVEPEEAVELNNTIVRLGLDEHKEISRILSELSRLIHLNEQEIVKTLDAAAVLDLTTAKVRFARDFECTLPRIRDDRRLLLREARHGVLETIYRDEAEEGDPVRKVVPIDVRLGDDFDLLVITGPNTGGKTVALKTVGLAALMTQAGVPLPAAEGSEMPVYRKVFVDIGDEQSLEQSLSTFSSHLAHILDILRRSDESTLVLIDELGAGTDPDEGAAIGRAVMDELLARGASTVVTTHLSVLKAAAFTEERVDNASVEFDVETLRPTYRLRLGEPGNSNALIIAERLGMPHSVIERAKSHMDGRHQALKQAIAGTLDSRRKAERAMNDAHQARLEAERREREMAEQARALEDERQAHARWVAWVGALRSGDEVFVRSFEKCGRIVRMQMQKQVAVVSAGAMEYEVALRDLTPVEAKT